MIAVRQETNLNIPNSEFLQKVIFFLNDILSFWINSSRFVLILWKLLVTFYSLLPLSLGYLACWAAGQTSWDTKCSIRIGEAHNFFGLHFGSKKSNWSEVVWIDHKGSYLNINMCIVSMMDLKKSQLISGLTQMESRTRSIVSCLFCLLLPGKVAGSKVLLVGKTICPCLKCRIC